MQYRCDLIYRLIIEIILIYSLIMGVMMTCLEVDDDLSLELESDELCFMAEAASTLLPDLDQSRHSCCNQRHLHIVMPCQESFGWIS